MMVSDDDAQNTARVRRFYAILPTVRHWNQDQIRDNNGGPPMPRRFRYSSDTNTRWLTVANWNR